MSAATLIAVVAVVRPEPFFSSPLFRLGAGIAPNSGPKPWNRDLREQPNFLCLLILGGLRADRAGFGPEPTGELPMLEEFAAQATRFESACAQASSPMVSLKSMLSGSYPANLILRQSGADQRSLMGINNPHSFMQATFAGVRTEMGAWLASEGYQVTAFSDAEWARGEAGFGENFAAPGNPRNSSIMAGRRWLQKQEPESLEQRHALIIHVEELLPDETPVLRSREVYASALQTLDGELGRLFSTIEGRGLWESGLVIVTADHGTSLGERGRVGHGELYLEQLMVPLGVKFPEAWKVPPGSFSGGVELVDLFPTVRALCGAPEQKSDGRSVLPIAFMGQPGRMLLVAQTSFSRFGANPTARSAIEPKRWQLIQDARGDGLLFYSLGSDPDALQPVQPGNLKVPSFVTSLFTERTPD